MTTSDNEWQPMTMSDSEWQRVVQRMKRNEKNKVILSLKIKQKASLVPEEFYSNLYAICSYYIFSNIANL